MAHNAIAAVPVKNAADAVPFRDLRVRDPVLKARLLSAVDRVLSDGPLLMGPEVARFEEKVAQYCGRKFCVGVSSGSDAIYLGLRAVGVGPGDEVICPAISWIASANAVSMTGATPVFVDVRKDQNIDPFKIEAAITSATKAIMPVHFTGHLAEMGPILEIARARGLKIVEDAAQAFGAERDGVRAGGFGDVSAFSLNPMKTLAGFGENGAVLTDSREMYEFVQSLRYLGTVDKERCESVSLNFKMDEIQAAMLQVNLDYLPRVLETRRRFAAYYNRELAGVVEVPEILDESTVMFDYQVLADRRDELLDFLWQSGIQGRIKHPYIMADQPVYAGLPHRELPVARGLVRRILSLPLHDNLEESDLARVVACVREFYSSA